MKRLALVCFGIIICTLLVSCRGKSSESQLVRQVGDAKYTITFTSNGNGTCFVTGFDWNGNIDNLDLVIPGNSPDGDTVIAVGKDAFWDKPFASVTLPDSVVNIEDSAFTTCWNLKSVNLSSELESIGNGAFENCPLDRIVLPCGLKTIGNKAFKNCALTEVVLPEGIVSLGDFAFAENDIAEINLPTSLLTLGEYAFAMNRISEIYLTDSIRSIGAHCFGGCPVSRINVGKYVESNTIAGLLRTGDWYSDDQAAKTDESLTLEIREGTVKICDNAFSGWYDIDIIILPKSIKTVGLNAFGGCWGIETILYCGSEEEWASVEVQDQENSCFLEAANTPLGSTRIPLVWIEFDYAG